MSDLTNTNDNNDNNSPGFFTTMYDKGKEAFGKVASTASDVANKASSAVSRVMPSSSSLGGRHRRGSKKRYYGGKFHANTPLNGIASNASPISGIQHTAKAHYVGGKRRRRRKSRRHRHTRHCKH